MKILFIIALLILVGAGCSETIHVSENSTSTASVYSEESKIYDCMPKEEAKKHYERNLELIEEDKIPELN